MITLTILTYNDAPTEHLAASFDELGGSIGRADNNQLVLPDPERTISRVHAQVVYRSGAYAIVDRGSNPVVVNGRPLGNGQEALLRDGDRVQIGGYGIGVTQVAAAVRPSGSGASADPFADLGFTGLAFGAAPAPAPAPAYQRPVHAPAYPPAAPPQASPAPMHGGIPDDWNPFAPDPVKPGDVGRNLGASPFAADDFGLGLGAGSPAAAPLIDMGIQPTAAEDSIDNLFGLGGSGSVGADPFAASSFATPLTQPNTGSSADPLRSLNEGAAAAAQPVADHASELNSPFSMPAARAPAAAPAASMPAAAPPQERVSVASPPAAPPTSPPASARPAGPVFSWESNDDGHVSTRPMVKAPAGPFDDLFDTPAAPSAGLAPEPSEPPDADRTWIKPASSVAAARPEAPPVTPLQAAAMATPARREPPVALQPMASSAPAASTAPSAPADQQTLMDAFLQGLAAPSVRLDGLTPELMFLVGQMLHESTRGAVELLVARAALKREVRAEVTTIVARENNPLKFSPSAEAALRLLLNPTAPGFMEPAAAMRDAFDDLRAHQLAFLAGMKAALEGVLLRFDPKQLEARLTQRSLLSSLLPASRKAQMWEVFQSLYAQISSEASDDFHELFGKAFLAAYEAQLDRLADAAADR